MTAYQLKPGCDILVIARDQSIPGRLIDSVPERHVVNCDLGGPFYLLASSPDVTLIAGPRGSRLSARARVAACDSTQTEFVLASEWTALDRRTDERFPARLRSGVRAINESDDTLGVTLDVSIGGMAIEVLEDPGVEHIEVSTGYVADPPFIPCEVVGRQVLPGSTILHLRFRSLDAAQRRHVDDLVRDAMDLGQVA